MDTIIRLPELLTITGMADSTIRRWERAGRFPKRLSLGPNSVGWYRSEIEAWLASRPRGISQGSLT